MYIMMIMHIYYICSGSVQDQTAQEKERDRVKKHLYIVYIFAQLSTLEIVQPVLYSFLYQRK